MIIQITIGTITTRRIIGENEDEKSEKISGRLPCCWLGRAEGLILCNAVRM